MNGQLDRLKTFLKIQDIPVKTKTSCFLSGLTENGKSFCLYNYAYHLSLTQKKILIIDFESDIPQKSNFIYTILDKIKIGRVNKENSILMLSDNLFLRMISVSDLKDFTEVLEIVHDYKKNNEFDEILINTKTGETDYYLNSAIIADEVYIICNSDAVSIMDAYAVIKILIRKHIERKIIVILNKVKSFNEYSESSYNLAKASAYFLKFDIPFIKVVPMFDNSSVVSEFGGNDHLLFFKDDSFMIRYHSNQKVS
jgi:flagellar biosynthesis protein FlhG